MKASKIFLRFWMDDSVFVASTHLDFLPSVFGTIGDSGYTTYLVNPTTIDKALTAAGATRVGEMAKADAKQIGANSQENVIAKWKENILVPLAKTIAASADDESVNVKGMQAASIPILTKIDPDYTPPKEFGGNSGEAIPMNLLVVAILLAIIAALFATGTIQAP